MTDSCGNCAFWHQPPNSGLPDDGGLCRRYPPQLMKVDSGANFYFPSMMRIAWCAHSAYAPAYQLPVSELHFSQRV